MKKTLIATAIAGAMSFTAVAQAAEVNYDLYGSLRVIAVSAEDTSLHITDNASRVGIKASTELNGGITGIARLEYKANTETGDTGAGRLAYIGATGDFGTVTAGRQWTPQYLWTSGKVDLLDHGSNPTHDYGLAGRKGNTLAYITPDMGGLQVAAVVIAAGGAESDPATGDEFDAYNLAAHFSAGDLTVGASTVIFNNNVDESYTAVAAGYTMGDLYVGGVATTDGVNDEDSFEVAASLGLTDELKVLANFVSFEDGTQVAAEAQYKLGAKSRVALSAVVADDDATAAGDSSDSIAASWRVDF